jgi:hypothetical protein
MNSVPPHDLLSEDPLVALWQTAPKVDTHNLVEDTQRLNRLHRRLSRSVMAIVCGIAVLLIFEEATDRLGTHGLLSMVWIVVVTSAAWRKRARCNRPDAMTLDTVSLLKAMIARAKSDLTLARTLYAGVPCGAVAGGVAMKLMTRFTSFGGATGAKVVSPRLDMLQTGAGVAALVIMIVAGLVLARSRAAQLRELGEKLKSIEADV